MSLEDIDDLSEEITEKQEGHIDDHKKIVRGLKSLKNSSVPVFEFSKNYLAGDRVLLPSPTNAIGTRVNDGLSRESYDSAEQALWSTDQTIPGHVFFNGSKGVRGNYLGVGAGVGSARMPSFFNSLLRGPWISNDLVVPGSDDYVLFQFTGTWNGGFSHLKRTATGGMTSGSTTVTLSSGTINADVQVGWYAFIPGAGPAIFKAKIVSIASNRTSCVIATSATDTVSNAAIVFSVAADPNFLFGTNRIYLTGNQTGDVDGIDFIYGDLAELYANTPSAIIKQARPMQIAGGPGGANMVIDDWTQLYIKSIENRGSATTIGRAVSLYVGAVPVTGATESYGILLEGGGKSLFKGTLRIFAQNASDEVLSVQTALSPTGKAFAVWDVTGTQRTMSINPNGSVNSSSFFTAFEGNGGGQVVIGQQPGSVPGIAFGTSPNQIFLKKINNSILGLDSATQAFATGSGTTAQRPTTPVAGAIFIDTTIAKPIFYIGGSWKDATGATV